MKKFLFMGAMMKEMLALVREHKLYFLSPLLLALVALTVLKTQRIDFKTFIFGDRKRGGGIKSTT